MKEESKGMSGQPMTLVIGIDCAVNESDTGFAMGFVSDGTLELQGARLGAEPWAEAVERIAVEQKDDRILLCLDSPLGWPESLKSGLRGHSGALPKLDPSHQLE